MISQDDMVRIPTRKEIENNEQPENKSCCQLKREEKWVKKTAEDARNYPQSVEKEKKDGKRQLVEGKR